MDIRGRKMKKPPACIRCRKRKIGCDRAKPMCGNCRKSKYPNCFYPDVPGKYIQSHSTGKLSTEFLNTSQNSTRSSSIELLNRYTPAHNLLPITNTTPSNLNLNAAVIDPSTHSRMSNNNPDVSSFQQFIDYNSGSNLSYTQNHIPMGPDQSISSKMNKNLNNILHVIPRNVPNLDKNPVGTALDSNITLHWVQGPAILDQMNSQYLSEDSINKEMRFLRTRLLELQEITGKVVEGIDLTKPLDNNNNNNSNNNNNNNANDNDDDDDDHYDGTTTKATLNSSSHNHIKGQKIAGNGKMDSTHSMLDNIQTRTNGTSLTTVDVFKDLDPQFLDPKEMFSIFDSNSNNNGAKQQDDNNKYLLQSIDTPNSIFTLLFLRNKDSYLIGFLQTLSKVFTDNNFGSILTNKHNQLVVNDDSKIMLLHNSTCLLLIKLYLDHVKETQNLIPPLNITGLLNFINQINSNDTECILDPKFLSLDQLIDIGNLSILLLIIYEMLSSTVLIIIQDEQLQAYGELSRFIDKLVINLLLVKHELNLRPSSASVIESLQFLTLSKFYDSITLFNEYMVKRDNCIDCHLVDFDEDIQHGLHLSLNHENKNDKPIRLWNFVCKQYLWRHIFKGEYSTLFYNKLNLNSTPILDPLLKNDLELLSFQNEIIQYLQSKDRVLSLSKIIGMKNVLKVKYEKQNKTCLNMAAAINGNTDSVIYRNTMLYIIYYLILQHEAHDDIEQFIVHYDELLNLLQETIFFIFSNLANKTFAGYEFLLQKRSFVLLNALCDVILSLYQRSSLAFQNDITIQSSECSTNKKVKEGTKYHSQYWIIIVRKLLILLQDYSRNCKKINPILSDIMTKMKIIVTYDTVMNDDDDDNDNTNFEYKNGFKKSSLGVKNIFEKLDEDLIVKFNEKLKGISESLINSGVYNNRDPYKPTNLETMGITSENFQDIFNAFKE